MARGRKVAGALLGALLLVAATAAPALADSEKGQQNGDQNNGQDEAHRPSKDDVTQVTQTAPGMHPGEAAWVAVVWEAGTTVDNFTVSATAPAGVTVGYPAGRSTTSLYGSSTLVKKTQDFSAFRVSAPYAATGSVTLQLHTTWTEDHGHRDDVSMDSTLVVPLTPYTGPDLSWSTTSADVLRNTPTWVSVALRAGAPRLDHVEITIAGPAGLGVAYPGGRASSGLNDGPSLLAGAFDHADVHLDASALTPGTYDLTVTAAYDAPDHRTQQERLSLVVS